MEVDGQPVTPDPRFASRNIPDKAALDGFRKAADPHLGKTRGILQPSVLTPFAFTLRSAPTQKREEMPAR